MIKKKYLREDRRQLRDHLGEGRRNEKLSTSGSIAKPYVKKDWSPIRQACSIVAIFSHRRPDGRWVMNLDKEDCQDRKAARQLLRSVGGVVG